MSQRTFSLKPIGTVRASEDGFCLEIQPEFRAALQGLEGFTYLNAIWWAHLLDHEEYRAITQCDQPYKNAPAQLGIFATRSPVRPNPIAVTPVAVLSIDYERGMVYIPYIDAEDGTPLIDLKPYHPCTDRVREVSVPEWCRHWPEWVEDSATFDWAAEFVNAQ
jgi:tRNA-Thr(GGU) m(6)t(6)A37 methyltransferase TsaA